VRALHPLDEPLSDLGAATIAGRTYLVGGYTGTQYASAILRVGAHDRTATVARLPVGLRYAGVATLGGRIYVAGGLVPSGESSAVYRVDPAAGTVRRIGTLPAPEAHAALAALAGSLYFVGGTSIMRIDPATGAVSRAATLPQPLADPNAVTLGNRVVIVGGGTRGVWELRRAGAASPSG
jgi:N-acetylneuraminic acid mutarotase